MRKSMREKLMKRLMAAILCLVWVCTASAFQPRTGNWWNPSETGRDFNIEIQDGVLVLVVYAYQASGPAQWYLASGPMTNSGRSFTGTLDRYVGGQCISCGFSGPPTFVGNDGVITINFTSETAATVTLPGGRTTSIRPFNFSGDPPQGLLGEWIFVYDVGNSTFAERFNFTTVISGTPDGNGIVFDTGRYAACEHQISGGLAGYVVCFDWTTSSLSTLENQYLFRFAIDEGYGGSWVSPTSYNKYSMKALKVVSKSGVSRISTSPKVTMSVTAESTSNKSVDGQIQCAPMTQVADTEMARIAEGLRQILCGRN
jgi:hypothetical protein